MSIVLDAMRECVRRLEELERTRVADTPRCLVCGIALRGRGDQQYCSSNHRQRAYRQRRRELVDQVEDDEEEPSGGGYLDTDWLRVKPGDHA